jgi:hypothetical protein
MLNVEHYCCSRKGKMVASRNEGNQLLAGLRVEAAERLLTSLVNADMPNPHLPHADVKQQTRLRAQTKKYWPDLWKRRGNEPKEITTERAIEILRKVRWYLQQFWKTQDPHARDWYIHRAREWYWRARVHGDNNVQMFREEEGTATTVDDARNASSWLNISIEMAPDVPPERTPFEESLFHLQTIAEKTRFCPNLKCQAPYFIATKKGQKFCSPECARPTLLASKRRYWNKRRSK